MAAGMVFDPVTLQTILQNLPELERRKKQAERLRGTQKQFQAMEQQQGGPNYQPTQQGGLYPTVARYQKDYAGAANKLVGALGGWVSDRAASGAEDDYSDLRNQQIMQTVEQMGQNRAGTGPEGGATEEALRGYLGMMGGPEIKDIIGQQPRVHSQVKLGNGNLGIIMSNSSVPVDTGMPYDYGVKMMEDGKGGVQAIGTSGAGRGIATPVTMGAPPQGVVAPTPQQPGQTPDDEAERWYQAVEQQESGGNQGAVSPKGATGVMQLMPATAREMEKALGMPPGSTDKDPSANRAAGRAYLDQRMQARNGDRSLALMDYNWGQGNVDKWIAAGADPAKMPQETRDYVQKVTQAATGQPAQAAGPAAGQPLRVPTKAEEAGASEAAKIAAQNAAAGQTAQAEAVKKGAVVDAETAAKIRAELPAMRQFKDTATSVANQLLKHPGLSAITGSGIHARVPDNPTAQNYWKAVMAGKPEADAMALHQQLKGEVFLQAFKTLKGGGQITEIEGQKAEQALARMERAQSTEAYKKAVTDFIDAMNAGYAKLEAAGMGGASAPATTAARPAPALPPGFSWEE